MACNEDVCVTLAENAKLVYVFFIFLVTNKFVLCTRWHVQPCSVNLFIILLYNELNCTKSFDNTILKELFNLQRC